MYNACFCLNKCSVLVCSVHISFSRSRLFTLLNLHIECKQIQRSVMNTTRRRKRCVIRLIHVQRKRNIFIAFVGWVG